MSEANEPSESRFSFLDNFQGGFKSWYQVPVLLAIVVFMLWVRLLSMGNFIRDGRVFFTGNDAYYHFRETAYVVRNWPQTMPFDIWTQFPYGTATGQFGTLFDQLMATAALIVGLGSPSDHTIAMTVLVAPAVFGAATAIPVYFLLRRFVNRPAALLSVALLAMLPGQFLRRSLVGFSDHHIAEVFFQTIAVLTIVIVLEVIDNDQPILEQFMAKETGALRPLLNTAAIAGIGIFLYIWTWPPGIVIVGILGIFLLVTLTLAPVTGRSPEHLALGGITMMIPVLLLSLLFFDTTTLTTSQISPIHLTVVVAVAVGSLTLMELHRLFEQLQIDPPVYVLSVIGLLIAVIGITRVGAPELFNMIADNLLRTVALGQKDTTLTVQEARSMSLQPAVLGQQLNARYGFAYLTALAGLLLMVIRTVNSSEWRSTDVFIVIWSTFVFLMALTQVRFNYYLAIVVVVLTGIAIQYTFDVLEFPSLETIGDIRAYQILTVLAIFVIVFAPLSPTLGSSNNVISYGENRANPTGLTWYGANQFLVNNTPPEGTYGGATNEIDYYASVNNQDDYSYPDGAYGVMSWWDYGHWITVQGERIPVANPFQQNAHIASAFLQAQTERRANAILEALPGLRGESRNIDSYSTTELENIASNLSAQRQREDVRYVMIDDQMAAGKFGAIMQWSQPENQSYISARRISIQGRNATLPVQSDTYRNTMINRLYFHDGADLSHYRLVHEVNRFSLLGGLSVNYRPTTGQSQWPTRVLLPRWGTWNQSQMQGVPIAPNNLSRVSGPVTLHPRGPQVAYDTSVESAVKVFERVQGATIKGTANSSNTSVFVQIQLHSTNTGRNFTYSRFTTTDENGAFAVTVPYATNDSISPGDGGTDQSIEAISGYQIRTGEFPDIYLYPNETGTATVPESAIYEGTNITVDLTAAESPEPGNETNTTNESTSAESIEPPLIGRTK